MAALAALIAAAPASGAPPKSPSIPSKSSLGAKRSNSLANQFVENAGQWNRQALFLNHSGSLNYWLTRDGAVLQYFAPATKTSKIVRGHVVRMSLEGASHEATASPIGKTGVHTSYLIGNKGDFENVGGYHEVLMKSVYKSVDVRYYVDQNRPRYDFIVAPGGNPSQIKMKFDGASHVKVDSHGDLVLGTSLGDAKQVGLKAFAVNGKTRTPVKVAFKSLSSNEIGFEVGQYNKASKLVIDPIIYGSYFGGDNYGDYSTNWDKVNGVVADSNGSVFMTGFTDCPDFPVVSGAFQVAKFSSRSAFLTRFRGDAYNVEYNSYISGTSGDGKEVGVYIDVDPTGNSVWVEGTSTSSQFPLINSSSFQSTSIGTNNFLIQFVRDANTVLKPNYATYFNQVDGDMSVCGFKVDPVNGQLVLAGNITGTLPGSPLNVPLGGTDVFLARLSADGKSLAWDRYFGGSFNDNLPEDNYAIGEDAVGGNGLALDSDGNAYIAGTVFSTTVSQIDLSINPNVFETTANGWPNSQLLRGVDAFLAKIDPLGATVYSGVIGGSGGDEGFGVAVDKDHNAYVLGTSGSFDYPRTPGTIGESNLQGTVVVSKIAADGASFLYSTGLNTNGTVEPVGIAVDMAGNAYMTGLVDEGLIWPQTPGNPDAPSSHSGTGSIRTSSDAIQTAYAVSANDQIDTIDSWLNVLNPTASTLVYGTYIGGKANDWVRAPYVDPVGDVWVFGETESYLDYIITGTATSGTPPKKEVTIITNLPAGFITPYAWKPTPNPPYVYASTTGEVRTYDYRTNAAPPNAADVFTDSDGYVLRFRLFRPVITSLVLNPTVLGGGTVGSTDNTTTGTITLSANAPAEGMNIEVTIDNTTAAAIVGGSASGYLVVNIPGGSNTGTFTIKSLNVNSDTNVLVKANIDGNFRIANLTVSPWLQQLTIAPITVVGGNNAQGRVTLVQAAPDNLTVQLVTDRSDLLTFAGGNTVTVTKAQSAATFTIATVGVATKSFAHVTASYSGVSRTQQVGLTPASMVAVSFAPTRVAGGNTATGTITLDGSAGNPGFPVVLTIPNSAPGSFSATDSTVKTTTVTFAAGDSSKTFTLYTSATAAASSITVTAHRAVVNGYDYSDQTITGVLYLDVYKVNGLTLNPTEVASGVTSTGTVTLSTPAPTGGVTVNLSSSDTTVATVPATMTIAAGSSTGTFTVTSVVVASKSTATITATRTGLAGDSGSAVLTVDPVTLGLSVTPTTAIGGVSPYPIATVALSAPAGAGGLPLTITLVNPIGSTIASIASTSVTVPQGSKTVSFPVTTYSVSTTQTATLTAAVTGSSTSISAPVTLTVRAAGISSITFTPSSVRGGARTLCTITLEAAVPSGKTVRVYLSQSTKVLQLPAYIDVSGSNSVSISVLASRVSRTVNSTVTASSRDGSGQVASSSTATVTVKR